ncbi:MAG: double zinc ribbon domain-containing protein [Dysgonamonadaceae bacterium]|jgi:ComF family protein|nr:double zinc ribbon domain-containing protein [Dysgonamonadaceae bacterium]
MDWVNIFQNLISLFYPPLCAGCSDALVSGEQFFCSECFADLPKTNYHLCKNNRAYEQLSIRFPVQKAAAFLYYNKNGLGQKTVAAIKYQGNTALGEWMAVLLANDLSPSGFFEGIDYLIPVPLHKKKQWDRGFNQSEVLAKGISSVTGIPLNTNILYRAKANVSQTRKGVFERWKNTQDIFQVKSAEFFKNKHLLLLDDVLTTGSTLEACARSLLQCENIKISVLTLAIA